MIIWYIKLIRISGFIMINIPIDLNFLLMLMSDVLGFYTVHARLQTSHKKWVDKEWLLNEFNWHNLLFISLGKLGLFHCFISSQHVWIMVIWPFLSYYGFLWKCEGLEKTYSHLTILLNLFVHYKFTSVFNVQ